ncbi:MAG: hypothetical protein HY855_10135 [Burkholderiales bacterium]|nr:hypothetical protein [Burkholderiales bacterium]
MSHSPSPLQIATKIHFYLMRELGQGIDVEKMLKHPRYARDVLLVCDACTGTELAQLAVQYRSARDLYKRLDQRQATTPPGHAAHPTEWSKDTTGFGLSRPMDETGPATGHDVGPDAGQPADTPRRSWFSRWRNSR